MKSILRFSALVATAFLLTACSSGPGGASSGDGINFDQSYSQHITNTKLAAKKAAHHVVLAVHNSTHKIRRNLDRVERSHDTYRNRNHYRSQSTKQEIKRDAHNRAVRSIDKATRP
ncbi:MAG: hypothetical protein K0U12_03740 [Gammaproteobacteria bacterium]|nr:hypothetical protein [Gammaproteobacteria bacterium]